MRGASVARLALLRLSTGSRQPALRGPQAQWRPLLRRGGTVACLLLLTVLLVGVARSEGAALARPPRLSGVPLQLLSARGLLWLLTCDRGCSGEAKRSVGRVIEIDPRTNNVIDSLQLAHPGAIAVGPEGIYVTDFERGTVRRLDPQTLRLTTTLHLKLPFSIVTSSYRSHAFLPEAVVVDDGNVWIPPIAARWRAPIRACGS
jgi:hypothetical protein